MKKFLLFFLLCGFTAFGQGNKILFDWWVRGSGGTTPLAGSGRTIEFANPAADKVWRDSLGIRFYTGTITVPLNTTAVQWHIVQHVSPYDTIISGNNLSVTHAFTYDAGRNVYDLIVNATIAGYTPPPRVFFGEMTCLPRRFTEGEADQVVTLPGAIGALNGSWTNRPGWKVYVKGNYTGGSAAFNPYDWRSDEPANPVRFQFNDNTITSTSFVFVPGASKNVIYDGSIDREADIYALNIVKGGGGTDQNVFFQSCGAVTGVASTHSSENVILCGIQVDNTSQAIGGAGIQVITANSVTFNYDTYTFDKFILFNTTVEDTNQECYYILHFTDQPDGTGRSFSGISNGLYYRNIGTNCAREVFQFGSNFSGEVFKNHWTDGANANTAGHRNALQWSPGNRDCAFYANYIETDYNIQSSFTGRRGKDMEFFSNVIYSTGRNDPADLNNFIRVEQNDTYANLEWKFFNNTYVIDDYLPWSLYNDSGSPTTVFDSLVLYDNLIVTNTATTNEQVNGFNNADLYIGEYQTTNRNAPLFFNLGTKNLRLGTLESPAYSARHTFTKNHRWANYDFEGYQYTVSVQGAYITAELLTGATLLKNITSIAAQTDVGPVANGTSWATVEASYLPTQVLVTMADGSTRMTDVDWIQGDFDGTVADTYTVFGNPENLYDDQTNTGSVQAEIDVEVGAPMAPMDLKINLYTGTKSTSTTSVNLATATFPTTTWTTQTGLLWEASASILIASRAAPTTNYVEGTILTYVSGTGVITLSAGTVHGTGTFTDWDIDRVGWWSTGSTAPFPGTNITVDYGEIKINNVGTGVGLRALNTGTTTRWNTVGNTGAQGGSLVYPNQVMLTFWLCQNQVGTLELYEIVAGTLTDRLWTVKAFGSRAGTGTRNNDFNINGIGAQTLNVLGNTATVVQRTSVVATSAKIVISIDTTPSDNGFAYFNAIRITSQ